MTNQDRAAFATLMVGMGETFNETVSHTRMEMYFAALQDLELEDVERAAGQIVQSGRFFPKPVELREAISGGLDDAAELAWGGLLKLVRQRGWMNAPDEWDDPAMKRAAMELYGGWQSLCERLPAEGAGMAVASKQFKAMYAAYARHERRVLLPAGATAMLTDGH